MATHSRIFQLFIAIKILLNLQDVNALKELGQTADARKPLESLSGGSCPKSHFRTSLGTCVLSCPSSEPLALAQQGNKSCVSQCPEGYFAQNQKCLVCPKECRLTCYSNSTSLQSCKSLCSYARYYDECVLRCPNGTIRFNDICLPSNYCTKVVYQGECVSQCPPTYFTSQNKGNPSSCFPCHAQCKNTCKGPGADQCLRCKGVKFENHCVDKCPVEAPWKYIGSSDNTYCAKECENGFHFADSIDKRCVERCPEGYSIENNTCTQQCSKMKPYKDPLSERCQSTCPFYDLQGQCIQKCPNLLVGFNHRCVPHCPEGYYNHNRECLLSCPSSAPFYHKTGCTACCPTRYRTFRIENSSKSYCSDECPTGMFMMTSKNARPSDDETMFGNISCGTPCVDKCPPNTTILPGSRTCVSSCPQHMSFSFKDTCVRRCPEDYPFVLNATCVDDCPKTMLIYNETDCVDSCPANMKYTNGRNCTSCCPSHVVLNSCTQRCPPAMVEAPPDSLSRGYRHRSYKDWSNYRVNLNCNPITCVKGCPDDFISYRGRCSTYSNCTPPRATSYDRTACVDSCRENEIKCPEWYYWELRDTLRCGPNYKNKVLQDVLYSGIACFVGIALLAVLVVYLPSYRQKAFNESRALMKSFNMNDCDRTGTKQQEKSALLSTAGSSDTLEGGPEASELLTEVRYDSDGDRL